MSGRNADSKLREELNRFVDPMPPGGRWAKIEAEAARRRRRERVMKAVAVPVTLLLIAALGYWAVDALRGEPMVVIDDSSGEIAGAGTTDATDAAGEGAIQRSAPLSEGEILQTVRELIAFLEAGEIEPSWSPPAQSDWPDDPLQVLRDLEEVVNGPQMHVLLDVAADQEDRRRVRLMIESFPSVEQIGFVSSEEAFERISEGLPPGVEGYGLLDAQTLEASFELWLAEDADADEIAAVLRQDPAVDEVNYGRPLAPEDIRIILSRMLRGATAKTAQAEEWLTEKRSSLVEAGLERDESTADPLLRQLTTRLEEKGVPIVSIEWMLPPEIENWGGDKHLTIIIEGSDDHAVQIAHRHAVERETSRANLQGVALDGIHLYSRDTDGILEYQTGWAPAGYAEASFWRETPEASLDTVSDIVGRLIESEAAAAGLGQPEFDWEEDANSYDVTISMLKGDATRQSLESFVAKVHTAIFEHNRDRGFNLASTRYLVTQAGEVVFTEIDDFQFQSRSVWSEPSLWPDWIP